MKDKLNSWQILKFFIQAVLIILTAWLLSCSIVIWLATEPQLQLPLMTVAALLCLAAAIAGLLPLFVAFYNTAWLGQAFLLSVPIRLLSTLCLGLLCCMFISNQQREILLLWLTGYYLIVLIWETTVAIKFVKKYTNFGTQKSDRRNNISTSIENEL